MKLKTILSIIAVSGLAACVKSSVSPGGENLTLSGTQLQQVSANNAFSLKLFKNLDSANTTGSNLFASPLSVSFALGMTANGSSTQTLSAINNTVGMNGFTQPQINSYYQALITNLPKLDPTTTIRIANSIWYRQDFSVLPLFTQTNSAYYGAKIQGLDFTSSSAVNTINNWINTQTNGAIPSVLKNISSEDKVILVNTIYFKSIWKEKFDPAKTTPLPFYLANNTTVQANFMNGVVDYRRYDDSDADVFELPYVNDKYSMVIVMPATGKTLQQLLPIVDSTRWKLWMSSLHTTNDQLRLPKFKFSYSPPNGLKDALSSFGMGIAFSSSSADFSLINPTAHLFIGQVLHRAYVDVDESGTTAAAATVINVRSTAQEFPPPTVIDHPFIFAIREVSSGLILFTGTVNNPLLAGN